MKDLMSVFFFDEDGAVTVDFVVLTAAICTLGFIVLSIMNGATIGLANAIRDTVSNVPVV